MSNQSFMDKLLDDVEVEWKSLGEVTIKISSGKNKDKSENGEFPVYGSTGIIGKTNNKVYEIEQILVARVGANAGRVNIVDGKYYDVSDNTLVLHVKESISLKYLYYYLVNLNLNRFTKGAGQPLLTAGQLKMMNIPIPSLEIQAEIVRILDTFTELTARKKQYEYYRNQLLTFEEGEVEWKPLGEVAEKVSSGGTPKTGVAEYWVNGTIPWMSSGEVNLETVYKTEKYITESGLKNSSAKLIPNGSIVIALAGQGKTRGKVARTRIDLTTNQSLGTLTFNKDEINPDYVFHFLKTQYENLRQVSSGSGTRGGLNLKMISAYKIPIPYPDNPTKSLAEQERIVAILDKFDALTNSITVGLPREIELRKKQYEYYREMLLTFPKAEAK